MKVPFLWIALGLSLGVLGWYGVDSVGAGTAPLQILPGFCLLAGMPFLWAVRGRKAFLPLFVLMTALLGLIQTDFVNRRAGNAIEHFAADGMTKGGGRISLEGIVKTAPQVKVKGKKETVSFVLESKNLMRWVEGVVGARPMGLAPTKRREFHETSGDVQVFLFNPSFIPEYGDRVRMWGKLEMPRPALNPGQFDYGDYLAQKNIHAIFNGFGKRSVKIIASNERSAFMRWVERVRSGIERKIEELYGGSHHAAIFKALILGKRKEIDPALREELVKTGTAHLLAISGLHIGLVAGSAFLLLLLCGVRQKAAAAILLVVLALHVLISGNGIPVRRAGLMAGSAFLGLILEREVHSWNTFFFALSVILLIDPQVLTSLSFQLSFLSVFVLILFVRDFHEHRSGLEVFYRSFVILLGTFPVILYYFNVFSFVSVFANAGAIPLFHLSLLSAFAAVALSWVPWIGHAMASFSGFLLDLGLGWIHLWTLPSWGVVYLATPGLLQMALYYVSGGLAYFFKKKKKSLFLPSFSLWILAAASFFWIPNPPDFSLTVFSAGQNELAYFQTFSRSHWLVNTGRSHPSDQGRWILSPFLKSKGVNRLQGLILTDGYRKHTGGLNGILRDFRVRYLFYPDTVDQDGVISRSLSRKINRVPLRSGQEIQADERTKVIIHSVEGEKTAVEIYFDRTHVVLIPSWSPEMEDWVNVHQNRIRHSDVLVLPSRFPESQKQWEEIFEKLDPLWVTVPSDTGNLGDYLKDRDIRLWDLSFHGALTLEGGKDGFRV